MPELDQLAKDMAQQHHALQRERVAVFMSVISRSMNVVDVSPRLEVDQVFFTIAKSSPFGTSSSEVCVQQSVSLYLLEDCMPLRPLEDVSLDMLVRNMTGQPQPQHSKFKIDDMFWNTVDAFKVSVARAFSSAS